MDKIYLDFNASTPLAPSVIDKMKPYLEKGFGNPSSLHWSGRESRQAIEKARERMAMLLECSPDEIIFTSGGGESNNLAIRGFMQQFTTGHIITSKIEHPAVLNVCRFLEEQGYSVSYLPVDANGILDPDIIDENIRPDTKLITIMLANNETGAIQPISKICEIAHKHDIPVHTDAAQAVGKIAVSVKNLKADLISIAGHKMYAPKGVGALYINSQISLEPILLGADHEKGLRPGTENVLEIVGLGEAARIFNDDQINIISEQKKLRNNFWELLKAQLPDIKLNGELEQVLPNTLNIQFPGIDANTLLSELPEIAASAGAACHADAVNPSHVLKAMGLSDQAATQCIRFSLGRTTTQDEIESAAQKIAQTVQKLSRSDEPQFVSVKDNDIKLTQYTHGLGCACKLKPHNLEKIINTIDNIYDSNLITGIMDSEDAAVYKIDEERAIVATLDFFTPIVDDPFDFGRIAAVNALSDIYAMGGNPLFGLNITAFPENRLPLSVLESIMKGSSSIAKQAGIPILGGHTIEDNEPKFGLVAVGMIHPDQVLKNKGAQPNDCIILTKPIGLGIQTTALKRSLLNQEQKNQIIEIMTRLNQDAGKIITDYPVNSCTDVTGFGLLGHLQEILKASQLQADLFLDKIPVISETRKLIRQKVVPGGTKSNLKYIDEYVNWGPSSDSDKLILCDAQTSGGLLFTLPEKFADEVVNKLHAKGDPDAAIIGKIVSNSDDLIKIN